MRVVCASGPKGSFDKVISLYSQMVIKERVKFYR